MITEFDVYVAFRKAQSNSLNRPYRLPKDWDSHFNNKMTSYQREILRKMVRYLATHWTNIDINRYFKYGFELWKGFTYKHFFEEQLIKYYIHKDRILKMNINNFKKDTIEKCKWLKSYMVENNIKTLKEYGHNTNGLESVPVLHFIKSNINIYVLTYLMVKKYLILNDDNLLYLNDYLNNIRKTKFEIYDNMLFFEEIDKKLNFL